MPSFLWIVLGALLVGGVSLSAGVFLGRLTVWRRISTAFSAEELNPQLTRFIQRLNRMIGQISQDVGRHQSKIEATAGELNAMHGQSSQHLTELVVNAVGKILESNETLQKRLHSAESKLQAQSAQLDTYLTKSQTDSLTRLPNRRVFDERLRQSIDEYERRRTPFALLMLDLDRFKAINDGFGHLGGDYVLRELGAIVSGFASEHSFAARLGGDELAVLADCESAEDACRLAEEIRAAVAKHRFSFEGVALAVTMSVGMAMIRPGETGSDLLGRTDRALYAAKAAGRNCGFFHDGKRCLPIDVAVPAPEDREGIRELCDELRQRMAEIVKG
ncbi:MAG: GGDEF domain-containing protein [Pirellulales bacterium]|nr:GGDEF domain-containing protein [Pirellulales bacterium]